MIISIFPRGFVVARETVNHTERACEALGCDVRFIPRRSTARYCSATCRQRANRAPDRRVRKYGGSRKPDLTCATCGKATYHGRGSLPQGEARCRDCRREAAPKCVDCGARIPGGKRCGSCHRTQLADRKAADHQRRRLGTRAWSRLRDQVVYEEPLCTLGFPGCTVWSETADHIKTVATRPDLMMERANLRGACHSCNYLRGSAPNEILRLGWVA